MTKKHIFRKAFGVLTAVIMLINSIFVFSVFGATGFEFSWEQESTLTDTLSLETKSDSDSNSVFLWWDFGVKNGISFDVGEYNLSYNIADNKRVDFAISKDVDTAVITYNVWDYSKGAYIALEDAAFRVYKTTSSSFIEPTETTYPAIADNYCINYDADGNPVSFSITPGTGFSFKYDNKSIKFKWVEGTSNDVFYFETDGIEQGNIYDFDIDLTVSGAVTSESLQVFTGINSNSFTSTPYANNRTYIIDHSTRPFADEEDPGYEPELVLSFDLPKVWDETTNTYVTISEDDMANEDQTTAIISLGNTYNERRIQVTISNIYADDINSVTTIATSGDYTVESERSDGKVYVNIKNLESGIIYDPTEITLYKPNDSSFLTEVSSIEQGTVYTYPEFTVVASDIDEFYLRITPYESYKGYYVIYQGDSSATLSKWIEYEDTKGDGEYIYIPIDLYSYATSGSELPEKFFRVDFSLSAPTGVTGMDSYLTSQVLRHKPSDDDIIVGTPENLTLDNVNITESLTSDDAYVTMTYTWDIAYMETLASIAARNGGVLELYYVFEESLIPNDDDSMEEFAQVKVTITSEDGEDFDMTIEEVNGEIVESSYTTKEVIKSGSNKYNTVVATVTFKFPTASVDDESVTEQFLYPNTYFVSVYAEYADGATTITTDSSTPQVQVVLDDIADVSVPVPQNFKISDDDITDSSMDLQWDTLKYKSKDSVLYSYYQDMVIARGMDFADKSIKYNIYVTQDKDNLDELISYEKNRDDISEDLESAIGTITFDDYAAEGIDLSAAKTDGGVSAITWLRNGNVLAITDIIQDSDINTQAFTLSSLDENQVYYIIGETTILPYYDTDETYMEDYYDCSSYTTIVTGTTNPNSSSPTDEENAPSSPEEFDVEEVGMDYAQLKWSAVHETPSNPESDSYLEYQFIRITGTSMDDDLIDERISYADVWAELPGGKEKAGFRVGSDGAVYEYAEEDSSFYTTAADDETYLSDVSGYKYYYITDYNLTPNELYFYYVRTVRVSEDEDVSYSSWVECSATSTPVDAPTNLTVESLEEYDTLSEVTISFDIPIDSEDLISGDYVVQYSLKEDDDDWTEDKSINVNKITFSTNSSSDLTHCEYTITNLESNTVYYIRVRLYHTGLDAASLYSNTVQTRTDFDQEEYENDRESENWLEYYKDKVSDVITNPYWLVYDSYTSTTAIYRPNSFQNIISGTTDTTILLAQGENNGTKKTYYLPSNAIDEAYSANKGFRIVWNDSEVVIAPRSINPDTNDAILDAKDEIKDDVFKDYFVKITVNFSTASYQVNGTTPVSPVVDLQIEVVGTKRVIEDWDESLTDEIIEKAFKESKLNSVVSDIRDEVGDDATSEELLDEIKDLIDDFVDDFQDKVETKLNNIKSRVYTSGDLEGYIYIAYPVSSGTNVIGNKNENGTWVTKDVVDYNGKKAILTQSPGIYALTGRVISIPGLDGVAGSSTIISVIGKYGLDDYLGKDNALNLSGVLSVNAAIGCAARMAGAGTTDDPVTYLSQKGVSISARNSAQGMQSQQILYLLMGVYSIRTNTSIDTIRIRNYTLTANINNISPVYKKSVQAAFELGICTNENLNAAGTMTVKEFLLMIPALAAKANL